jgi:hypothetical protein
METEITESEMSEAQERAEIEEFEFIRNARMRKERTEMAHVKNGTLRDYFASRAPEVPDWFEPVFKETKPVRPSVSSLPEDLQKLARDWIRDPCFDLCDANPCAELAQFQKDYEAAVRDEYRWDLMCEVERFFQWRWYYADKMIKQREKHA